MCKIYIKDCIWYFQIAKPWLTASKFYRANNALLRTSKVATQEQAAWLKTSKNIASHSGHSCGLSSASWECEIILHISLHNEIS